MATIEARSIRYAVVALTVFLAMIAPMHAVQAQTASPAPPPERIVAVFQARPLGDQVITSETLDALAATIRLRLSAYGISDFQVQSQGSDQITAEMPKSANATRILPLIGQIGLCEFVGSDDRLIAGSIITTSLGGPESVGLNPDGTAMEQVPTALIAPTVTNAPVYQTLLQSMDIADAVFQPGNFGPVILLTLSAAVTQPFSDYTDSRMGTYINVVVDKRVLSSATIQSRINGVAALEGAESGGFQALVVFLRSGPLIAPLALIDTHPL
jgi:preprotein translocase subunit SecD